MRTTRTVALTPAGEMFLAGARKILIELEHLKSAVRSHSRGELGHLRIGAVGPALNVLVPSVLRELMKRTLGIEISLKTMSTEAQVDALLGGEIEAGFVRGVGRRTGLRVETVADENYGRFSPVTIV